MELQELAKNVNDVVDKLQAHKAEVKAREEAQDFSAVDGVEFNVWAYDTIYDLTNQYDEAMTKYNEKHMDLYGWFVIR